MTPNDVFALLVLATAVRVFASDLRYLTRRLLRAGVRVGAAALIEDHHRGAPRAPRTEVLTPAAHDEEAQP
ncbi:hypothetical protein OIE62_36990 [Streptomyces scopuliridis]|uniref:Uncharacterized protein n=2 Tax=Streptomyces scopuliridis TaxID=452529 RepID=A0A2T7T7G5_9ACTN|nr:hypothetical protein [Streptomyces scopuliridis]PVE11113.1 hypothetical protein Y717_17755 [Streptomyces scopuliridis RB72]WSB31968.1 hypothetical protein OG949_03225 [Streptomyces scopuliridis]WSB96228.1 hypothetical protein OG835_03935 [Streptomyces scopuliridis]WSC10066.1 hypothetical protein OIE62_36990 [Streptomyces scopuliridis]